MLYDDFSIPPLRQTLSELEAEMQQKSFLNAWMQTLLGSVRASVRGGVCHIERLIVHPDARGQGIGSGLLARIEQRFAGAAGFALFTGQRSQRNLRLYERFGYVRVREERMNSKLTLVHLEKSQVQPAMPRSLT